MIIFINIAASVLILWVLSLMAGAFIPAFYRHLDKHEDSWALKLFFLPAVAWPFTFFGLMATSYAIDGSGYVGMFKSSTTIGILPFIGWIAMGTWMLLFLAVGYASTRGGPHWS